MSKKFTIEKRLLIYRFKYLRTSDYYESKYGIEGTTLLKIIGYEGEQHLGLSETVLIKLIRECIGLGISADVLLMAFNLLQDCKSTSIGVRRKLFLERSNYLELVHKDDYEAFIQLELGEEKEKRLQQFINRLSKKEDDYIEKLVDMMVDMFKTTEDVSKYVENVKGYARKTTYKTADKNEHTFCYKPIPQKLSGYSQRVDTQMPTTLDSELVLSKVFAAIESMVEIKSALIQSTDIIVSKVEEHIHPNTFKLQYSCPAPVSEFIGRKEVMEELSQKLNSVGWALIYGVAGIGKTELIKQFVRENKGFYSTVCYLSYKNSIFSTIANQLPVTGHTSNINDDELYKLYFDSLLNCDEHTLLIIDDFGDYIDNEIVHRDATNDPRFDELRTGAFHVVFISETPNLEGIQLKQLPIEQQLELFLRYYRRSISNEDREKLIILLETLKGHSITIVLLAKMLHIDRMMSISKLSLQIRAGVHKLSDSIGQTLERVFSTSAIQKLSNVEKYILTNMILLPPYGLSVKRFSEWVVLDDFSVLQNLIDAGWIELDIESDTVAINPVLSDLLTDYLKPDSNKCKKYIESLIAFSSNIYNSKDSEQRKYSSELISAITKRIIDDFHLLGKFFYINIVNNHVCDCVGQQGGWGPERKIYTREQPPQLGVRTFNSYIDNPIFGDERNFVRVREYGHGKFTNYAMVIPGRQYEVQIMYHNNAPNEYNASGKGIMNNVRLKAVLPQIIADKKTVSLSATLSAANATPSAVWDASDISTYGRTIYCRYVRDTAVIHNQGTANGSYVRSKSLFSKEGALLPHSLKLWGIIPGGKEYAGIVIYRFVADYVDFFVSCNLRSKTSDVWHKVIHGNIGDKLVVRIRYLNTGSIIQNNVIMKVKLPNTLQYVSGSTTLENLKNISQPRPVSDGICSNGLNVGGYQYNSGWVTVCFSVAIESTDMDVSTINASCATSTGTKCSYADMITSTSELSPLPVGVSYDGDYNGSMRSGYGIYKYSNGTTYAGNSHEDEFSGKGDMKMSITVDRNSSSKCQAAASCAS